MPSSGQKSSSGRFCLPSVLNRTICCVGMWVLAQNVLLLYWGSLLRGDCPSVTVSVLDHHNRASGNASSQAEATQAKVASLTRKLEMMRSTSAELSRTPEMEAKVEAKEQMIKALKLEIQSLQNASRPKGEAGTLNSTQRQFLTSFVASNNSLDSRPAGSKQIRRESSLASLPRSELRLFGEAVPKGVVFAIGFGSVSRRKDYVLETVGTMLGLRGSNVEVNTTEREKVVVVAHLADFNLSWVSKISKKLQQDYSELVASGRFHGIHAPEELYPLLDICPPFCSYKDEPKRVRWRSKQNLDYAFLMSYAAPLAPFYLQIEDDLNFASHWISKMEGFLAKSYPPTYRTPKENSPWRMIDFSQLGFIGKLFHSEDLLRMAQYLLLFYDQMPCDLVLGDFLNGMTQMKRIDYWKRQPSLFQHVGLFRSLGGIQPLEERKFGKRLFDNPPGVVIWNMTIVPTYTGKFMYFPKGEPENRRDNCDFDASPAHRKVRIKRCWFWGKKLQAGDHVTLLFERPTRVKGILVEFGHGNHPEDLLLDGALQVAAQAPNSGANQTLSACGDFLHVLKLASDHMMYWEENASTPAALPVAHVRCVRIAVVTSQEPWMVIQQLRIRSG